MNFGRYLDLHRSRWRGGVLRSFFAGGEIGARPQCEIAITMNGRLAVWTKAISGLVELESDACSQRDAQRAAVKKMVTPAVKREALVRLRSAGVL